jgi:orotidine-5'-phosphate decarboxylase
MTESFAARFAAARAQYGPLVLGADPHGSILAKWDLSDDAEGLERFADIVLQAATGTVAVLKPQSAFYERHGWQGIRVLTRLVAQARANGILVILDAKRGDVGSTNDAYAQAYLGPGAAIEADALTISPYLGLGAMSAYTSRAHESGSCVFVVLRSSNPEGRTIQISRTPHGFSVEQHLLAEIGTLNSRLAPGTVGPVGAVVAALDAGDARDPGPALDLPDLNLAGAGALFLVPGVGAQGTTPADVARTFADCPERALPSASRSLLTAGPDVSALRDAAARLSDEFRTLLDP